MLWLVCVAGVVGVAGVANVCVVAGVYGVANVCVVAGCVVWLMYVLWLVCGVVYGVCVSVCRIETFPVLSRAGQRDYTRRETV